MRNYLAAIVVIVSVAAFAFSSASVNASPTPQAYDFVTIDSPEPSLFNVPLGINNRGDIVGGYLDATFRFRGYVRINGTFIPLDFPGATQTGASGITENRTVTGTHKDAHGFQHGFVWRNGQFQTVDVPGVAQTVDIPFEFGDGLGTGSFGMNEFNALVGEYATADGVGHGWLKIGEHFVTVDHPNAAQFPGGGTTVFGVNNLLQVAGQYRTGSVPISRGFVWTFGRFTPVDHPNAGGQFGTQANGINDRGEVVGVYSDANTILHGFVLKNGQYRDINFPGAAATECHSINDRGDITGTYFDTAGIGHGFVAYKRH